MPTMGTPSRRGTFKSECFKNDKMISQTMGSAYYAIPAQETGNLPGSQSSMPLEMRRNPSNGPHMAIPSTLNLIRHP